MSKYGQWIAFVAPSREFECDLVDGSLLGQGIGDARISRFSIALPFGKLIVIVGEGWLIAIIGNRR